MFCSKCGEKNSEEAKFCKGCGAETRNDAETTPHTHTSVPQPPSKPPRSVLFYVLTPVLVFVGVIIFWGIVNLIGAEVESSPLLEFINNVLIPFIIGIAFLAFPIGIIYGIYANSKHYDGTIKCGNCSYVGPGKSGRSSWAQVTVWILFFILSPLITIIYYLVTHKYVCPKCDSTFIGLRDVNGHFSAAKNGLGPLGIVLLVFLFISIIGILAAVVLGSLNDAREAGIQAADRANDRAATSEMSYNLEQELIDTERQLNSLFDLPAMVDESTRLDRIFLSNDNTKLNYAYTIIDFSSSEFVPGELAGYVLSGLRELYCEDVDMAFYRTNNIPMKWSYYGNDRLLIDSFELTNSDCL